MTEVAPLTRTLLSAATSGLVAGTVLWAGWALGPPVERAWAASESEGKDDFAEPVGTPLGTAALSSAACDEKGCESKKGSFAHLEADRLEVKEAFVSRSETELHGSTQLHGPTQLRGPTEVSGSTRLLGAAEAHSTLVVKKDLTVEESLVVEGDLQVRGNLQVLGKLQIKGKMDFPSQSVSCVDTRTHDQKDKVCPIGDYSLCLPTRQSGICDLERASTGSWTLTARNPRGGATPSRCEAVCF